MSQSWGGVNWPWGGASLSPAPTRLREVTCADKGRGREVSGPVEWWRQPWATVFASLLLNPSLSFESLEPPPRIRNSPVL
ncbi:rCG45829, isoform CRA_d [Rattus norvegicus]|uniref:RCG45829, isoform CRA_d n=1 Tax=Rattus norvegicus TaxID=10116 RepID=A6JTZ9_RAT|nr:rCG45829, isoform CRA_d [Rattus norvegicus]